MMERLAPEQARQRVRDLYWEAVRQAPEWARANEAAFSSYLQAAVMGKIDTARAAGTEWVEEMLVL